MYQLTVHHSPDSHPDIEIGQFLSEATDSGLTVADTRLNPLYDETSVTLRGTRDQFLSYFNLVSEGDWGSDVDEFMDMLVRVAA